MRFASFQRQATADSGHPITTYTMTRDMDETYSRLRSSPGSSASNSPTFSFQTSVIDPPSRSPSPTLYSHGMAYRDSWDSHVPVYVKRRKLSLRTLLGIPALITIVLFLINGSTSHVSPVLSGSNGTAGLTTFLQKHFPSSLTATWSTWSLSSSDIQSYGIDQTDICSVCNDSSNRGAYSESSFFSFPLPTRDEVRQSPVSSSLAAKKRYLLHHIQTYLWLNAHDTPPDTVGRLSQTFLSQPDSLISLSLTGMELDKPTAYLYTRTGNGGRLTADIKKLRYMQRHVDTIKEYDVNTRMVGHYDGTGAAERQLIWIVIEDDAKLNDAMAKVLNASGLPYLYLAHGPTRHYGNAQWNIAERAVHILRDTFFGDGPVLNADDDSRIVPELLSRIWRVKRVVMWQVGNLHWEGPLFENGTLVDWYTGTWPKRRFPIDMNGFAINSSLIGNGRPVHPPAYVPVDDFGGETEFIEQIISNRTDVEPLCDNSAVERCHMSWHNWVEVVIPTNPHRQALGAAANIAHGKLQPQQKERVRMAS